MTRKIFFALLACLALALLYAWSRVQVIQLGYEVSKAKSEVADMTRENALLKSKVAQEKSTMKVAEWAKRLGFASPETNRVLFIQE